jgi:phage-related minor tail protein
LADDFGLKIGIEGEKEFKNAIREINQSFKVLGSEMNLVASQFDKQDKSVEAVAARNRVLSKEIVAQKEKNRHLGESACQRRLLFRGDRPTDAKLADTA